MNLEQLMRPEVKDDWGIKELQNCILNIAKYIHDFCEENGIQYCIMGGTALGAVRHGGFIPWDDDLDIFMTPDNYERFRDLFWEKGDKTKFYLQEMGGYKGMVYASKLRMNNTEYIEESLEDWDIHHGVFVDIFILHNFPEGKLSQYRLNFWEKYLALKGISMKKYKKRGPIFGVMLCLLKIFPKRFLVPYALTQIYHYRNKECHRKCHLFGKMNFNQGVYLNEVLLPFHSVKFETVRLMMPSQTDRYLSQYFGDYMRIPAMEEIKKNQHTTKWSVSHSFRRRKSGTFSDEQYLLG